MSTGTLERSETVQVAQEIPVEGTVTISLAQVDDIRYPNYRKKPREAHLIDLYGKMKEHQQLTPCVGAWTKDGKIAIIDGFCRLETLRRIALEKLVREYNTANGKESTDPGFISLGGLGFESHKEREKIREAGGEWTAKYEAALKGQNIIFRTVAVENDVDAALKSIVANTYDKPPLMDLCDRIETLLTLHAGEVSQKQVAKELKMSEPAVSQHRKIKACPAYLLQLFAGDLSELVKKDESQETVRNMLLAAVTELERRLSLEQENPQSISFSHAREFSGAVMNNKDPMTLTGIAKALKDLVVMQDNGKLSEAATPDYTVYMSKLREAKRIGKKEETPPAQPVGAASPTAAPQPSAGGPAVPDTSNISADVAARFDQAAGHVTSQPAASPAPVSSGNIPPAIPAATQAGPTLSPEDLARRAEIEAANAPQSDRLDDLVGSVDVGDGTPVGGAVAAATGVGIATPGQMDSKTKEAPVLDKYKNRKSPEKIENAANRMLDYASDVERVTATEQAGYLLASAQLFNAVGMDEAERAVNEVFVNFNEGLTRYLTTLENTVKETRGEAVLKEIQALRPTFTRPQLAK